jgi:hypothetical protein
MKKADSLLTYHVRSSEVTVMRHIFPQSFSILFLTHLMIKPAIVCHWIALAGIALFFCAR